MKYSKKTQLCFLLKYAFLSRLSEKFKRPLICSFKLTNKCNLKCIHCPFWREEEKREMKFLDIKDILKKLYSDGVRIVIFEGGEPLLWKDEKAGKDINDVIKLAQQDFFFVGMTTNGTLPLQRANPDITFISIDGLKETHERIRGKSFDRIIDNIKKHNMSRKIIVNTCINKLNYKEVPELIRFLNDIVYGVTIQFFYPYPGLEDLYLDDGKRTEALESVIEMKKKGYKVLDSLTCLERFKDNSWRCRDFLVSNVDPDKNINYGCYLKRRVKNISCKYCGFAAHCEVSMAYALDIRAIMAAKAIFWGQISKS